MLRRYSIEVLSMRQDFTKDKKQAHELVDRLAPGQVSVVVGLLEAMLDPVARAVAKAVPDNEPLTPEEEGALDQACNWLKHNRAIPNEEVLAEFGITPEEIEHFK